MNESMTLRGGVKPTRDTQTVFGLLSALRGGRLEVRLPGGAHALFGEGEPTALLRVADESLFGRVLARGDIGFAEAYLDGAWDTPDLPALLTLLAANRETLRRAVYGAPWRLLAARLRHLGNRNSRAGSRRNILAHYDLGNDFYRLWLDRDMSYSAAIYRAEDDGSPERAQQAKYRRVLDRLRAAPGERVLEIGCGWGAFARLAVDAGLQVTGLTLSPAQLAVAREKVPEADLRLQDYRDLNERFDHVVSIEMFEAVGERWWPGYFRAVADALAPGGRAVVQTIVIRDELFADYRKGTDFIQQYVFPGGMLPSPEAFRRAAAGQGLAIHDAYAFGAHYAATLAAWRAAFERNWPAIRALGFDERFRRLWRFYLAYCEAGFRVGDIDVVQYELAHATA